MKAGLITLLAGLFFLVGALIARFEKNNKSLNDFSIGMAFSVMILLLALDIIPDALELLGKKNQIFMYIFIIIGLVMLKLMDLLVPHHDHNKEIKHHERHLNHIGIVSSLALIIHNVIEGMSIYNVASASLNTGLLMAIGVGLHNIPFGIEITSSLSEDKKSKKNKVFLLLLLTVSTFLGAVIMMIIGKTNNMILGCLMSLAAGMIIYLVFFELLEELEHSKSKKISFIGMCVGLGFVLLNLVIGG